MSAVLHHALSRRRAAVQTVCRSLLALLLRLLLRMFENELDDEHPHRSRSPSRATRRVVHTSSTNGSSLGFAHSQAGDFKAGEASSQASAWGEWCSILAAIVAPLRMSLGAQKRPLHHHSMYTGMNSQQKVFLMCEIDSMDMVGAEQKDSARLFMRVNGILPRHCHVKAEQMLADTGDNDKRADIFTAGFPCQPFSHMSRKKSPPHQHPLFPQFLIVIRYIRRTQPRLVLLENVSFFFARPLFLRRTGVRKRIRIPPGTVKPDI